MAATFFRCNRGHTFEATQAPDQCPTCGDTTLIVLTSRKVVD